MVKKFKHLNNTIKNVKSVYLNTNTAFRRGQYQGKKVKLNDPIRGGSKKFYVYVKNDKGNVVKVSFGDTTGLSIKRDDPARSKSFRARHNCDNPGPKMESKILVLLSMEIISKCR